MKRITGLRILSVVAVFGGGMLCAAPGPDNNPQAGGPPSGAPREMAGERQPAQPPQSGLPNREVLKQAGATDAQIQALTDADFALRAKQVDLRGAVEKAGIALNRLMTSTNAVDETAVMAAADAMSQARGELFKLELTRELQFKKILGDEILRKLRNSHPSTSERTGNRMMPGAGGPGAGPNAGGSSTAGRSAGGNQPPPPPPPVTQ